MSGIEDRVVRMNFENSAFERAVGVTLSTLDKLKKSLNFSTDKKNGLDTVQDSANRFSMGQVGTQIEKATAHWNAWRAAGLIAFATVVHQAVIAGEKIVKAFTIDPIHEGFKSYTDQINATQTILANTKAQGTNLKQVTATLAELQTYANMTVYSFSDMTTNIAKFTAAGVPLKDATASIKGMANVAALSGANTEQMSSAMYQMSQALSTGTIKLQDWNSLSNANMAGTNIQKALEATAHTMGDNGKAMDAAIKKGGNFRNSLQEGWLTSGIFNKTMGVMAGTLDKTTGKMSAFSVAQLKAKGYSDAEAKSLHELSQSALDSAIQIRTLPQMTQALKEEVATAYGAVFKTIFGDINEATKLFTGIHTVIEGALTGPIYALNDLLTAANKLGARKDVIQGFVNVFHGFMSVLGPIKQAFRDIFPPVTAKQIAHMAHVFQNFTEILTVGTETAFNIRRTFAGVFAIFDIGVQIVSGIARVIGKLIMTFTSGNGEILHFTGNIGDMLVRFDQMLRKSGGITHFFSNLGDILVIPVQAMKTLKVALASMFDGFKAKDASNLQQSVGSLQTALAKLGAFGDKINQFFSSIGQKMGPAGEKIKSAFSGIGKAIGDAFSGTSLQNILGLVDTGLLAGITLLIKRFFKKGINVEVGGGAFKAIKESFEGLTGTMKAMQMQLKAKALMEIAVAIGIITASVVALSLLNPEKMQTSMKALAVGFSELLGAMAILTKISNGAGLVKMPVMAASLNLLATAIGILVASVVALSLMSLDQLKKGLGAVAILLGTLVVVTKPLAANSEGMIAAGLGISAMAVALDILYFAVLGFSKMSWKDLEKGLAGVAGALVAIAAGMRLMPKGMVLQAAALVVIAAALNAVYLAVKEFSTMDWKTMGRGLAGIAGALVAIALGMQLMPKDMVLQSAGLVLVSGALQLIARAVESMSKMSWKEIGKGLATLAGALVIIAGGMYLMTGALPGAAALLIVSAALAIFVPVLQTLGNMSWKNIGKGLAALAASFAVIGVASLLLAPVIPLMIGLGLALGVLGAALVLSGAGALLWATSFTLMAGAGMAGISVLLKGFAGLIAMLPTIGENLALALTNFLVTIAQNAPAIIAGFTAMLSQMLQAIVTLAPQFGLAITALLQMLFTVIQQNTPTLVTTGLGILMALLKGISDNIVQITDTVLAIITKFVAELTKHMPELITMGVNFLVALLTGIGNNLGRLITAAVKVIATFINGIGQNIGSVVSAGLGIVAGIVTGLGRGAARIAAAGVTAIITFISALGTQSVRLANAAFDIVTKLVNDLGDVAERKEPELIKAFVHLGEGIIKGIGQGLEDSFDGLLGKMGDKLNSLYDHAKGLLHINSPSKVYIPLGSGIMEGMAKGVNDSNHLEKSMSSKLDDALMIVKNTIGKLPPGVSGLSDFTPTITPVLNLDAVHAGVKEMRGLFTPNSPINAAVSLSQATGISNQHKGSQALTQTTTEAINAPLGSITLNQINNSPKALSAGEIYMNTRNQLAQMREVIVNR